MNHLVFLNHPVGEGGVTPHSEIIVGDEPPCSFCHALPQVIEQSLFLFQSLSTDLRMRKKFLARGPRSLEDAQSRIGVGGRGLSEKARSFIAIDSREEGNQSR